MLKVIKYEKKNGIFYYTHSFYNNVILSHKFSLLSAVLMIANFFFDMQSFDLLFDSQ